MWQLWEDLLDEELGPVWTELVDKHTSAPEYVDASGRRWAGPRGRTFSAFDACGAGVAAPARVQEERR